MEQTDPGRGKKPKPDMNAAEKSDQSVVPERVANAVKTKEPLEGRGWTKENT
jgi:hypothetical protein